VTAGCLGGDLDFDFGSSSTLSGAKSKVIKSSGAESGTSGDRISISTRMRKSISVIYRHCFLAPNELRGHEYKAKIFTKSFWPRQRVCICASRADVSKLADEKNTTANKSPPAPMQNGQIAEANDTVTAADDESFPLTMTYLLAR